MGGVLRQEIEADASPPSHHYPSQGIQNGFVEVRHRCLWRNRFHRRLVAEYLAAHYKGDSSLKWAMAAAARKNWPRCATRLARLPKSP